MSPSSEKPTGEERDIGRKDESGRGRILVTKKIAVRGAIVALVVGAVLIVLGTVIIEGARHEAGFRFGDISRDQLFLYDSWDFFELVTGIILTLAGTATVSVSLTYLLLNRKRKGV